MSYMGEGGGEEGERGGRGGGREGEKRRKGRREKRREGEEREEGEEEGGRERWRGEEGGRERWERREGGRGGREEEVVHVCERKWKSTFISSLPLHTPSLTSDAFPLHTHSLHPSQLPPYTPHLDGVTKTISLCPHSINDATDKEPKQLALGSVHHHHGNIEQVETHEPQQ